MANKITVARRFRKFWSTFRCSAIYISLSVTHMITVHSSSFPPKWHKAKKSQMGEWIRVSGCCQAMYCRGLSDFWFLFFRHKHLTPLSIWLPCRETRQSDSYYFDLVMANISTDPIWNVPPVSLNRHLRNKEIHGCQESSSANIHSGNVFTGALRYNWSKYS